MPTKRVNGVDVELTGDELAQWEADSLEGLAERLDKMRERVKSRMRERAVVMLLEATNSEDQNDLLINLGILPQPVKDRVTRVRQRVLARSDTIDGMDYETLKAFDTESEDWE